MKSPFSLFAALPLCAFFALAAACGEGSASPTRYSVASGERVVAASVRLSAYYETCEELGEKIDGDSDNFSDEYFLIGSSEEFESVKSSPKFLSADDETLAYAECYGEEYFAENYLVFIADWQSSGSTKLTVKSVSVEGGRVDVVAQAKTPSVATDDMRLWIFIIELPAGEGLTALRYTVV